MNLAMKFTLTALAISLCSTAIAGESWDNVRSQLYGDRPLLDGAEIIALDAPYRTPNDARTQIAAQIAAPKDTTIQKVTLVLDENPMPVSAVFALQEPQQRFFFDTTMRVNGPTPLHVVAEMTDGRTFVVEGFVKTSGQGACSAPPGTDPELALATLGNMALTVTEDTAQDLSERLNSLSSRLKRLDVDIDHPSHSGMQMDQITLLFIPMRYVETVEIETDTGAYVDMTGSISLSENPQVSLSVPGRTRSVDVTMTDTDGTVSTAHKDLAGF
jgi:sulfur-oxidizing protein SoxY